jgi:hypothetical protein
MSPTLGFIVIDLNAEPTNIHGRISWSGAQAIRQPAWHRAGGAQDRVCAGRVHYTSALGSSPQGRDPVFSLFCKISGAR